ncbi:hypothetical protein SAMN06265375_10514 [Muriicola jejuensis]|uniref:Uncharacterized protein n=1 Tax=Muriicola jejuensis TaxID=504488 RepID=A0A6P0UFE3_9FLAO|nr:hypothetical protein [Muriicola jejuensis]NER11737.1 hypothetical protein [Muriicola jejuensis]SMP24916.1 hypothetical protein SAMN06265375_10514 [Muriicola jejuensis]
MSSIRTQFTHKSIMLGILFLGVLLNSQFESWSSEDAVAEQADTPALEVEAEQPQTTDSLEATYEEDETAIAGLG